MLASGISSAHSVIPRCCISGRGTRVQICADFRAAKGEQEKNPWPKEVFGEDLKIFQIPDKFYGPPRGGFTSGYERSSEPMLTRTKDIYYPEYVPRVYIIQHTDRSCVRVFSKCYVAWPMCT